VGYTVERGWQPIKSSEVFVPSPNGARLILGGVEDEGSSGSSLLVKHVITRDGQIELCYLHREHRSRCAAYAEWFTSALAVVLELYDTLRNRAGTPSVPAEIDIQVETEGGDVKPLPFGSLRASFHSLPVTTAFPRYTVAERTDFDQVLNDAAADLMNAGGLPAVVLPRISLPKHEGS
jgi:hypothetical protein